MTATKKTAKGAEAKAADAATATIEAATKAGADAFKGYEDVLAHSQNNMEALMEVSAIWFKGIQDINKEVTALANTSLEQSVNASKQILGCKTVDEVVAVHSELSKTSYDNAVAESRKLSDMSIKLAENTAAPIAVRVNETVATFVKPLAA